MPRAGKRVRIERGLYKTGDLFYACATPPGSRSAMWKRASSSRRGTIPSSCRASSADEAIAYARIPAGTFRKWVAAGRIPAHGGRRRPVSPHGPRRRPGICARLSPAAGNTGRLTSQRPAASNIPASAPATLMR